jgi:hypothetical protein
MQVWTCVWFVFRAFDDLLISLKRTSAILVFFPPTWHSLLQRPSIVAYSISTYAREQLPRIADGKTHLQKHRKNESHQIEGTIIGMGDCLSLTWR